MGVVLTQVLPGRAIYHFLCQLTTNESSDRETVHQIWCIELFIYSTDIFWVSVMCQAPCLWSGYNGKQETWCLLLRVGNSAVKQWPWPGGSIGWPLSSTPKGGGFYSQATDWYFFAPPSPPAFSLSLSSRNQQICPLVRIKKTHIHTQTQTNRLKWS